MGYDYYYGSSPEIYTGQVETVFPVIMLAIMLVMYAFMFLLLIGVYVAESLSIYKLCKKLNIDNAFLGFIPFANSYKFGEIADVLCQRNRDNTKLRFKKLLLILHIATVVSIPLLFIPCFAIVLSFALIPEDVVILVMLCSLLVLIVVYLIMMAISITMSVFYYMALYKIFKYTDEKNSTLYFILSLVLMLVASFAFAPYIFLLIIAFGKKPIPDPYAEQLTDKAI